MAFWPLNTDQRNMNDDTHTPAAKPCLLILLTNSAKIWYHNSSWYYFPMNSLLNPFDFLIIHHHPSSSDPLENWRRWTLKVGAATLEARGRGQCCRMMSAMVFMARPWFYKWGIPKHHVF